MARLFHNYIMQNSLKMFYTIYQKRLILIQFLQKSFKNLV